MRLWISGWALSLCTAIGGNAAADVTVDFETIPNGTSWGSSYGTSPNDFMFSQNGVDIYFTGGSGTARIGGYMDPYFPTTPITLGNVAALFEPPQIGGATPTGVSFEYVNAGGNSSMRINGATTSLTNKSNFATPDGPVDISVTSIYVPSQPGIGSHNKGVVTITGPITSIAVGGQEFGIDNVSFVPEPTSLAMFGLGGLGLLTRRRSKA